MKLFAALMAFLVTSTPVFADACLFSVTYKRPNGGTFTSKTCILNGARKCNDVPRKGYCRSSKDPGVIDKTCEIVPHC